MFSPLHSRWWLTCLCAALFHLLTVPATWQVEGVDEIEYLSLAHSLNLGHGYTLYGRPHVYYPPAYPWALAKVLALAPVEGWRFIYGVNALLGVGALAGFGHWLRRRHGEPGRWAAWLALVSYYGWSFGTRFLLAEPLFLVFSLAALALASTLLEQPVGRGHWPLLAACALFAAMTKSASVALAGALMVAGGVAWLRTRRGAGLALAALTAASMLGFNAYWQMRADAVNPQAAESYLRWAKRFLTGGAGANTASVVDRNQGEGIDPAQNTWPARADLLAERLGQTVLSIPRVPEGFRPVAWFVTVLVLAGLALELRSRPDSPLAWYVLLSLLLYSLTSWVSSYLRYLYVLLPLLFLFALKGLRALVLERARRASGVVLGGFGGWMVLAAGSGLLEPIPLGSADAVYQFVLTVAHLFLGFALCLLAVVWFRRKFRADPASPPPRFLAVVLGLALLHNGALAVQRVRLTASGAGLEVKYLHHVFACARWIRAHTPPDARIATTYPELVSYLMQREAVRPADCRHPGAPPADLVLCLGILSYVPGMAWLEEECLRQAMKPRETGSAIPLFQAGLAGVYRDALAPAPDPK